MKASDFEKAKELKEKINNLYDIKDTIINASDKDTLLGAVKYNSYTVPKNCYTISECHIPEEVKNKFIYVIENMIKEAEKEFESI